MPRVQYRDMVKKIDITKNMVTPKKITSLEHWYKSARKAIPEIPPWPSNKVKDDETEPSFNIFTVDVTIDWIKFDVINTIGERVHVVIQRRSPL